MTLVKTAFWLAVAFVAYVYAGYAVLLAIWARVRPRPVRVSPDVSDAAGVFLRALSDTEARRQAEAGGTVRAQPGPRLATPAVSIIIAARNEAPRIAVRLRNLLALDYPAERRQIIVVSDGSSDNTAAAVSPFMKSVELMLRPALGKASALNAGVAHARHEILVFADARQTFAPDALRRLVRNFDDPSVGAVSGELVLDCEQPPGAARDSSIGEGLSLYWRYEKWLRRHESLIGSTLGATGAIYAMRRSYWRPLPLDAVLDDVLAPMRVVLSGKRVVFDGSALAYDRAAPDARAEARRKIRTLAGNYQLIRLEPRLLVPGLNPVWLQFVSHKLGRLLVPYALILGFCANVVLAGDGALYAATLTAQIAVALLAAYGAVLDRRARRRSEAAAVTRALGEDRPAGSKGIVNA